MIVGVCDSYSTAALKRLERELGCKVVNGAPADVEALLIRSRTDIDDKFLKLHPKLRAVVSATSGFDHIDVQACRERKVVAMHTPDANAQSAAELTIYLMLSVLRRASDVAKLNAKRGWKDELKLGRELSGKTVGIIGLGRVGGRVARLLKALGCEVIAHDPYQSDEVFADLQIARSGLTEVLVQSQILTLHVPLTRETQHLVNQQSLKQMPAGAILINTSRGKVVDEAALMEALTAGDIAGVGLDVFENEPLQPKARLRELPNVAITPHIGAYTEEAIERASEHAVDRMIGFLTDGTVRDPVPNA